MAALVSAVIVAVALTLFFKRANAGHLDAPAQVSAADTSDADAADQSLSNLEFALLFGLSAIQGKALTAEALATATDHTASDIKTVLEALQQRRLVTSHPDGGYQITRRGKRHVIDNMPE